MIYLVYCYLVLFIIRPFDNWRFLGAIHLERIYGVIMVAALFLTSHKRSIRCLQTTLVFAFLGALGMSFAFSYKPQLAWLAFYKYCTLVVFYVVILATIKNEAQLRGFAIVYVCTMAAYDLLSLREYFFFGRGAWSGQIWRMVGFDTTFGGPNSFAASVAYSMPFAFGLLRGHARWRVRLAVGAYAALGFACIILTGSRSGLLTFLLVCLLYVLSLPGRRKFYAVVGFLAFFLISWPLVPADKKARVMTLFGEHMNEGERGSAEARIRGEGFQYGLRMFLQRPVFGVGLGCFASYQKEQLGGSFADAHNLYGELLGQLGVLGTLAFAVLVGVAFKNALYVMKRVRMGTVPRASPTAWVAWAVLIMLVLLLFEGWASHNLDRYNWLWAAAIAELARGFVPRKNAAGQKTSLQEIPEGAQAALSA